MKRIASFIAAIAMIAASTSAFADGALAIGQSKDPSHGLAIGMVGGASSGKTASRDALQECKTSDVKARTLCRVVKVYSNQCAAIAMDPRDGTPGFGWSVAKTEAAASKQALANCKATAGKGRANACRVAGTSCDS
jgi:hypothetical protein